ncbi:MAG TPA: apolipoprotein N-acyltransferase [Actinomycetota bacterium]
MFELLSGEASEPAEGQGQGALPGLRLSPSGLRLPAALLLSAASGAALFLAFPPVGAWPLVFVAPIPLLWLVRGSRPRRAAACGFVFGFTYFGSLLYWILLFGELGWLSLVLMSAGWTALFGLLAPAIWRPRRPVLGTIGLACLWTVIEWARAAVPLGGFAWGQLGTAQVDAPALPLASLTGVWGLSFLVLAVAGLILLALERWLTGRPAVALVLVVVVLALAFAPAVIPVPAPDGEGLEVAVIQVDVDSVQDLVGDEEDIAVAMLNVERHLQLADDPPDLVVWGEGALDPGALDDPATMAAVRDAIATVGAPTLAGAVTTGEDGSERTATLAFDGTGTLVDTYVKVKLVPFGEYVPFRSALQWISATEQVPVDRVPGDEVSLIRVPGLPPIGTPICYENSFPAINREMVDLGAGFLAVTINNASYERTAASEQHLQMSRLRAVENARWVVHAAVSGISAFVDPDGGVVDRRGLFEPATMRRDVTVSTRRTVYTRLGDWVPLASLVVVLALVLIPRGRSRRLRPATSLGGDLRALVILPTYNERATIGAVIEGVRSADALVDVLVVDDASPDGTAEVVRERANADAHVRLVERPRKSGLASAYAVGFDWARVNGHDLVVEMDSDLSHLPEQLGDLLEAARAHDVVIGSRYVPGGSVANWSRARVALSRAGNVYARMCLGFDIHDATSGFRVYRREALDVITREGMHSDGYGFQIELAYRAWNEGLSVGEVPITFREREHGHSKISRRIVLEALWLVTVWGLRARFRPRRAEGSDTRIPRSTQTPA